MTHLWKHTFENELRISADENPILLSEPPMNPKKNREKMCELMFEDFKCPQLYIANQSVLSLYANGRITGMVVDCGAGVTHFAPISEGYVQKHFSKRLNIGGRDLTAYMQKLLLGKGYKLSSTLEQDLVRDLKEELCFVSMDYKYDLANKKDLIQEYELPDGKKVKVGKERMEVGEILFKPTMLEKSDHDGIDKLCHNAIMECAIDIRKDLRSNIILCGGCSMMPNFVKL
eukprot:UN27738